MHYNVNVDFSISLLGFLVFALWAWGGYRGYKTGGIVMGLSLFALLGGVIVASVLTLLVYKFFVTRSLIPEVFASVVLGLSFIGVIWFSSIIQLAVVKRINQEEKDRPNRIVGVFLGITKYFIIGAIYSAVLLNLDCRGHFLPQRERKSVILTFSRSAITKIIKSLKMDGHMLLPCYPDDIDSSEIIDENNGDKNNNDTVNPDNQNQQNNNSNNNNSIPIDDAKNP